MSNVLVSKIKLNNVIYEIADKNCEALIVALTERVNNLSTGGTGGITVESDPVYLADKPNIALKSEIPTKLSELEQDIQIGGITTETDPTVPDWAKASTKPVYTWNEIQEKPTLFSGSYNDLTNKPALFSGNYNDLTNKPSIPSVDGLVTQEQLDAIIARLEALEARPAVDGNILDFGGVSN